MSHALAGPPLRDRIERAWPGLSPQERRVAEFLRARPDESALYNSSELARLTGVSKATVSRLFRRLGFADSAEARDLLRAQRGGRSSAGEPDPLGMHLVHDIEALRRLHGALDREVVGAATAALAAARRVVVVGLRSGLPAALQLAQALGLLRPDVVLLPAHGRSIAEELVGLTEQDVVVVVAPDSTGAARLLEVLGASPVRVVAVGGSGMSAADWRFAAPADLGTASAVALASLAGLIAEVVGHAIGACGEARATAIAAADELLGGDGPH